MSDTHDAFWEGFNSEVGPELSKEETEEIFRVMLTITLDAFGKFSEEHDKATIARRVVRAFAAASQTYESARKKVHETKLGVYIDIDPDSVVAAAFTLWTEGIAAKGIPAPTRIGEQILGFAQGMSAIRTMHEAQCILEDPDSPFSFAGEAAEALDSISG